MKRILKNTLAVLIAAVMVFGAAPLAGFVGLELPDISALFTAKAETAETSGTCGDNLTWTFDESTGTLTISGEGEMYNYSRYDNFAPWHLNGIYSVTIEDGVTSIGDYAFFECHDLNDVIISDSVTKIGASAFENCESIASITISENVIEIGSDAFIGCSGLKVMNYNAACFLADAFSYSMKFDEINLGPKVENQFMYGEYAEYPLNVSAFAALQYVKKISVDPENKFFSTDEYGVLFNKNKTELIKYPLLSSNTEYIVPESVKVIGAQAFGGCTNLKKIDLSNVEEIQLAAFNGCINLAEFKIPDTVKKISAMAFLGTARYKEALNALDGCSEKEIYFENHLVYYYCDETITSYDIRPGTKTVASVSFFDIQHTYLETVTVPESVSHLGFDGLLCSVKQIIIHPDNPYFNNGEDGAVYSEDMSVLVTHPPFSDRTELVIPSSVSVIGSCAFMGVMNIKEIELANTVKEIKPVAFAGSGITSFRIPKGIERINYATFLFCSNLSTLYIPESVKYIGMMAVEECDNLTDVYYEGTEEEWNQIVIVEENGSLENATIHFNSDYHTHKYTKTVTKEATCTENGSATYTCECGETYIEVIPAGHVATTITVPATCKATGMSYDVCINCGISMGNVKVLPKTDHTPGEWEVIVEATAEAEGKKVKKCTVCGEVLEEEIIPKLAVLVDDETGVELEYNPDDYEETPKLNVDETFDEVAIQILELKTDAVSQQILNITLTIDGEKIQPNGYVTIRLPIPEGFDKDYIHIYYINSQTGEAEKFDSRIEGDYIVFETNHFSYYAVAQVCDGSVIIKTPSTTTVSYGDSIILHADITGNLPEGAYIEWTADNGNFKVVETSADGTSCRVTPESSGDTTFTATVYDANGNIISEDEQKMTSKAGFLQKIIAFFKKLFGLNKIIPELIRKSL